MKKLIFLLFALGAGTIALGQFVLKGQVIDAETRQPLEGASVFAQNTTMGTVTANDGVFRLPLSKGGFEVVVTYTGYNNSQRNVQQGDADSTIIIEMRKEDRSMSEVVITTSNEVADGWEKYGDFFMDHFIGATPFADSCAIMNPEVVKFYFYKRSNKLKVLASEPLQIDNRALGYHMRYALDSFVYYFKTDINSYRGLCLYAPMQTEDAAVKATWATNREQAYYGSRLHFLRSYFDSTLKQDGFTVDLLSRTDKQKFNRLTNPYDTTYYFADSAAVELWFPAKASITYNKQKPEHAYLRQYSLPPDVKVQISYIDLTDAILILPNGFFLEQRSWINQGYWSWKNLADQLPYDYEPGQVVN